MEATGDDGQPDEYSASKPTQFRFKSQSKSKRSRAHDDYDDENHPRSKRHRSSYESDSRPERKEDRHRHRHRHHHHSSDHRRRKERKKKRSPTEDIPQTVYDRTFHETHGQYADPDKRHRESIHDPAYLDPDTAFRESLFDALADDEGAAYWESVYGEPIHVYPAAAAKRGPDGELERMDEEEYAEYVRRKMWEKSHEYILEEREAREKERKRQRKLREELKGEAEQEDREREEFRRRVEESLRRGQERKRGKEMEAAWLRYFQRWEELKNTTDLTNTSSSAGKVREVVPWPVASGKWKDASSKEDIERFLRGSTAWKEDAPALLKVERVRWHPDKMQQRFGQHIDEETMKSVTAVFQVIDALWNERRK